jgi:DNA-binding XRE family transcriptional regulator
MDQKVIMPKPISRAYSRYSRDALLVFSQLIRRARIARKLTTQELAERAGISRGLVQRIEKGDPACAIGAFFEVAAIVGVRLFNADHATLSRAISANDAMLALLPKSVRPSSTQVNDDF